ncbi:uncharacterized protein LOC142985522 isoform X1 [Anticarsia gemmatalis]|uniref:uncharacterized protein LOC142985522 isoform X1 n=1 Tax=Anticarsia gemmatalis TaxID=129554 RepID=UPI003F777D8B
MLFLYILSFISTLNGQTFTGDERSKASRPALRQLRESVVQVKSFLDALQRHIRRSRDALRQHMHDYDLDMDIFTDDPLKTTTRPTTPYSPTFQFTLSMTTTKIFPNKPDINYSTTETPSTISTPEVNLTASEQLIMEVAPEWWVTYKVTRPDPNDVTTVLERVNEGETDGSFEVACLLAGTPPWDLDAKALASLYTWREEARGGGSLPAPQEVEARRAELRQDVLAAWKRRLEDPSAGLVTIEAVRPAVTEWLERGHGALTYRLTQVLTGHGCFGKYLCRIGREQTPRCHHCGDCPDTALHTLAHCQAWSSQRRQLTGVVGSDLSLSAVVLSMVGSEAAWSAVASFCEEVISLKEAAEREREINAPLPSRARRTGRRRRRDDLRPP